MNGETTEVKLTRIETKLDVVLKAIDDHEERVRSLEDWRSRARGVTAMLIFVIGTVGAALGWIIDHFSRWSKP